MSEITGFQIGKVEKITNDQGNHITINIDLLKSIFKPYANYPVAITAVAGPLRSGKSFLLNVLVGFLKQYQLHQDGKSVIPDLGPIEREIKKTFSFRGGADPDTKGINILDKPFLLNCKRKDGSLKKVALFLIDTQGLFDNNSSAQDIAIMGTLTFLLSSRQCFNVKELIDKMQLEHIFKFAEKVKAIDELDKKASLFQEGSLMFIVRDWYDNDEDEDYPHGLEGGKKYLDKALRPAEGKAQENNMMKRFLDRTFGEIPCYLMPDPGPAVRKKKFTLGELSEDFREHMLHLFEFLTKPEQIVIKKSGGKEITCKQLSRTMEVVASLMKHDISFDDAPSCILVAYEAKMHGLTLDYANMYIQMILSCGKKFRDMETNAIEEKLKQLKRTVLDKYDQEPKCDEKEFEEDWNKELKNLLQQIYDELLKCAKAEKYFIAAITEYDDWVKKNTTGNSWEQERFKQNAQEKRNDLLKDLKRKIAPELYDKCEKHFESQAYLIQSETEAKVKDYFSKLNTAAWVGSLVLGGLVALGVAFFPPAALAAAAAEVVATAAAGTAAATGASAAAAGVVSTGAGVSALATAKVGAYALIKKLKEMTGLGVGQSNYSAESKVALAKYEKGKIDVTLCFGDVTIELKSNKINLAAAKK